jgi:uncharacterized RDD family membrane protein YckC
MKCPQCGLLNPPEALRCDCGWDFASKTMQESYVGHDASDLARLASLGDRFGGQLLDSLVAVAAIGVSAIPYVISDEIGAITLLAGVCFALFYILFADGFQGGQSYGKRMLKTAVVDARTGRPCSFGQSFVRNLFLSILGVIDWVFIFGKRRQRLGDKAAHTIVVNTVQ